MIEKINSFEYIQNHLLDKQYFVRFEFKHQLCIDSNLSDKDIKTIIYHIRNEIVARIFKSLNVYSSRQSVE